MPPRGNDALLDTIAKDVWRTQPTIPFFSSSTTVHHSPPTEEPPQIEGEVDIPKLKSADALANRLRLIRSAGSQTTTLVAPEITFSAADSSPPSSPPPLAPKHPTVPKKATIDASTSPFPHRMAMLRILYVHALLHPDQPYNQAMPSLLAPLYLVLAAHQIDDEAIAYAEADAFWAFGELMGDVAPIIGFPGEPEHGEDGVRGLLRTLSSRLKWADEELWDDLVRSINSVHII